MTQVVEFKKARSRRLLAILAVVLALALTAVGIFRNSLFHGNFGVVDPGYVYRSAQPAADLERVIERYHLATILNLRGGSHDDDWYAAEVRTTRERGIDFFDLPMSATRRPRRRELLILLDLFERCRYPLLIHCKSGSDRTGLASALYRMSRRGESPEQAFEAFSLDYGHVPLFGPEHLHEPLQEYRHWLADHHLTHRPERFRTWVEEVYVSDDPPTAIPPLRTGPRRPARPAGTGAPLTSTEPGHTHPG